MIKAYDTKSSCARARTMSTPSYTGADMKKLEQLQQKCARFLQLKTEWGQKQPDINKQP